MPQLKTRRYSRYKRLRLNGFLPFEARPLSRVPFKICPYMRQLIADRRAEANKAIKGGLTKKEYEQQIKDKYKGNKWQKLNRVGKVVADPWRMLRDYEDRWRAKQPDYSSPWEARMRKWRDFIDKIERTMQKQKGLA